MAATIIVGTNSWVTVAEADSYFETKYGASTTWASLSNDDKTQLLISAYYFIQDSSLFSISPSSTSDTVKRAQYETAWWIYNYKTEWDKRTALIDGGVTEFEVLNWMEELGKADFPSFIKRILDDFKIGSGFRKVTVERDYESPSSR